ncbi:MAG: hypothetical protein KIT31_16345 [Deltaproteobacteria bacterium]|nr:hypothetical protein [Deltaproteobacteria bacterium]
MLVAAMLVAATARGDMVPWGSGLAKMRKKTKRVRRSTPLAGIKLLAVGSDFFTNGDTDEVIA